jgi:uncharacterized protein YegP (UPF0339 family)
MSDADHQDYLAAFEVYQDASDEWRWRLLARNGNIIADSAEGYSSKISALNGVDTVRSVARDARIDPEWRDGEPIPDGGPITDVDLVPVDEDVVEAGYPVYALNQAILSSQERFRIGLTEREEGDNWTDGDPHGLAVAVHRNARSAALALDDGHHAEARQQIGDALNYLLFLRNLISMREGGDSG